MTARGEDPVMHVLASARRRLRLASAMATCALALWPLAAIAWLAWLMHRYVHALTAWQLSGLASAWLAITAIVTLARLPTRRQTPVLADRAVGARSLLVSALEFGETSRRGAAAERVARDAAAAAPGWLATLRTALPVAWPAHGTVAIVAIGAAALVLSLPGARANPPTAANTGPMPGFSDSARALSRAIVPATRSGDADTAPTAARGQTGAPVPVARNTDAEPSPAPDELAARLPQRRATATGTAASGTGDGDAASAGPAPPVDAASGAAALVVTRQPIARRGDLSAPGEAAVALGGTDAAGADDRVGAGDRRTAHATDRYRSPAMRGYLSRVERLTRDKER